MSTSSPEVDALINQIELDGNWRHLAASTTDKDYRRIVSFDNATSYSQLGDLHACPRRFQLSKADAKSEAGVASVQGNLDFAFGHSVGAGVQTLIATGDLTAGLFAGFISWKADYFATTDTPERKQKKHKSIAYAQLAIEKFAAQGISDEWEIYTLQDGTPAVELAFVVDMENGYQHYGHIDLLLRNKINGRVAVWELKTDGFSAIDEAKYANSSQALGYGVILDLIEPELSEYDVIYAVYSTTGMEWQVLPFVKSLTHKAEWVQDILLDHHAIQTYRQLNFFPKRGESCFQFNKRCRYFGICDLTSHVKYVDLPPDRQAENVNFLIKRSDIIKNQRRRME